VTAIDIAGVPSGAQREGRGWRSQRPVERLTAGAE
jgi:hypothetical protein